MELAVGVGETADPAGVTVLAAVAAGVGDDATGAHATTSAMSSGRSRLTEKSICSLNDTCVSGVPANAYECARSC